MKAVGSRQPAIWLDYLSSVINLSSVFVCEHDVVV